MDDGEAQFEEWVSEALDSLPPDIAELIDNVAVVVEDEPPPGQNLLGLYRGVPQTRRTHYYTGALPDLITLAILAGFVGTARPPRALGKPYLPAG